MSADSHRVEAILAEVAAIADPAARAACLNEACAGDTELRREVESLLAAHEEAGAFLESPASGAPFGVPPLALGGPSAEPAKAGTPSTEQPGDRIGRYRLLEQIGEGGMGVVWMAEQVEPVRRRVALKIIKLGMDTKEVIARFEAERQALALMDHPNIAKVHDGGATETGRPYFVMELVRGLRITDYCDQHRLSTAQRLELFTSVCQAVQHAHQKGVIHRDLKPSNILVTVNEGVPMPKVIDFGIAKATDQRLTDKTLFTRFMQFMGTPAYMSPEQAELTSLDIDTRSDIYALGVLLYELLTGCTPYNSKELLAAGIDEMRRVLRESEPPRPSTRLNALQAKELDTAAQRRQTEPPRLISIIRGDLDWIVMKCLEKDRKRRYETAKDLANDLGRYLDTQPILARPPSTLYRCQKFAHRHRRAIRATVALAIGLTSIGLVVHYSYRDRVAGLKTKADAWDFQRPDINTAERQEEMLRSIHTNISRAIQQNTTGAQNVQNLTYSLAQSHLFSERFAEAEQAYLEYLRPLREAGVTNNRILLNALSGLSHALQGQGKFNETEPVLRQYLALLTRHNPDIWQTNKVKARLGCVLLALKRYQEAEPMLIEGYSGMMDADRSIGRAMREPYEKQAGEWIVRLYSDWDRPELALEWSRKLAQPTNSMRGLRP